MKGDCSVSGKEPAEDGGARLFLRSLRIRRHASFSVNKPAQAKRLLDTSSSSIHNSRSPSEAVLSCGEGTDRRVSEPFELRFFKGDGVHSVFRQ